MDEMRLLGPDGLAGRRAAGSSALRELAEGFVRDWQSRERLRLDK
ncbi:hypothetical protein ACIQPR_47760 [Streptomyces sp. NPDC091280]